MAASARKRAASSIHSSADGNGKAEESKSNIFLEDLMLVNEQIAGESQAGGSSISSSDQLSHSSRFAADRLTSL